MFLDLDHRKQFVSDALGQLFMRKCGETSAETRSTRCIDRLRASLDWDALRRVATCISIWLFHGLQSDPRHPIGTTAREASEESLAHLALDLLAYPRPEPVYGDTCDGLEGEEASILYQRINYPSPPRDIPESDECGNPLEEEEDEWDPWAF